MSENEKPLRDQIRRQGEAALREMRMWPARKRRNLPQSWFVEGRRTPPYLGTPDALDVQWVEDDGSKS